jgi:ATP-binding cassette, subfamily B, bacterial
VRPLPTWDYTLRMARYAPWLYLLHAGGWSLMNLLSLLPGLIARSFFDALTGAAPIPGGVAGLLGLLLLIGAAQTALWLGAGSVEINLRFTMSGLVRRNLLRLVLALPGASALRLSIGETISRFRDDGYEAEDNMDWTDEIISAGVFATVAFLILLRVNTPMALAVVVPTVVVAAVAQRASAALGRYRAASSQATSHVTGAIGDIVAAVQTVQAAGAEERVVAHFRQINDRRRSAILADRVVTQVVDAITANTVSIGTGLIMLIAAGTLRDGSLTVGDFVLFVAYLGFIADFTTGLGQYLAHYRQTGVAFARMDARGAGRAHAAASCRCAAGCAPTDAQRGRPPDPAGGARPDLPPPTGRARDRVGRPAPAARHADGGDRAGRRGQDDAPARAAWPAAAPGGRDLLEWRAGG